MTSRQLYEALLIELNKENAPNILLEDFNYFANKAIYQYINKRYNIYDINQQTTDDLRVLKATASLPVYKEYTYDDLSTTNSNASYYAVLPSDYLHILNCICIYDVNKTYKCYTKGNKWRCAATRLTADAYSQILDNFWTKPSYKRPYYYINNVNETATKGWSGPTSWDNKGVSTNANVNEVTGARLPTDPVRTIAGQDGINLFEIGTDFTSVESVGEDANGAKIASIKLNPIKSIELNPEKSGKKSGKMYSLVEKSAGIRYGNVSSVRIEIRYGTDDSIFKLSKIFVDYIKTPQNIRLTQEELDKTEDVSQILEYPDYACQEIVNELAHIIMENISEQRLQTHPLVSQSIANPAQQQAQPVAQA